MKNSPLFDSKRVSLALDFDLDERHHTEEMTHAMQLISVSGVQEKFPAVVDGGKIRLARDGERSTHILKPAPWDASLNENWQIPANEHLTMQIASQVYRIETAANALCFFRDGEAAYVTRRFDVAPDGSKYQQEDLASLAGLTKANGGSDYKYSNLSYEECAEIIGKYTTAPSIEILKFFRIVVFNYLILNDDAHLKNFSLIHRGDGEYHLAPAYDLINTSLHLYEPRIFALDKGLFREGMQLSDTRSVNRGDFEEFGRRIGLAPRLIKRELDTFATEQPLAKELIHRSFLSEKLKHYYWQSFNYRRTTLQFG